MDITKDELRQIIAEEVEKAFERRGLGYDTASTPRFKHDCEDDVFLGHYDGADLYFADHGGVACNWHSTISIRWSDYEIAGTEIDEPVAEALRRAMARGLLKRREP